MGSQLEIEKVHYSFYFLDLILKKIKGHAIKNLNVIHF